MTSGNGKIIPVRAQAAALSGNGRTRAEAAAHAIAIAATWRRASERSRRGKPRDACIAREVYWQQVAHAIREAS